MTLKFETQATISASPDQVWKVLVDTASWPSFDPFCERVEGTPQLGGKLKVFSKLSPGRGFGIKVTQLDPPRKMVWSGGMPFGLFKGERTYVIRDAAAGVSDFR